MPRIENNTTMFTEDRLYKIAEILEVYVADLLEIELKISAIENNDDSAKAYLQK